MKLLESITGNMYVSVQVKSETVTSKPKKPLDFVEELKQIRSRIDAFIDKMDQHTSSSKFL